MKKKLWILVFLFLTQASFANSDYAPFFGAGNCYVESLPCKDGTTISCQASGSYGGYCLAEKNKKEKIYTVTCVANPGSSYRRSCFYK